jgi:hypothetical protein
MPHGIIAAIHVKTDPIMPETLRPVAVVGGARIPFARSNTAYL